MLSSLPAKPHFWVNTIHDAAYVITTFEVGRKLPLCWPFILVSIPLNFKRKVDLFLQYSKDQVRKRVARQATITRTDFFSNLLSEKASAQRLSEEWLIAQANVLVIAGSDTTATALSTIIYFLTRHPQSLQRLQDEVRAAFQEESQMNDSALQALPYLAAVIEEGLRMFPPTAFGLPRISPGAIVDGHYVPSGVGTKKKCHRKRGNMLTKSEQVTVSTSSWATTRREKYWTSPRTFLPERFLPPTHALYDKRFQHDCKGATKPFSLGPRGCLGVNLANMEMRLTLAKLVWTFDMKAAVSSTAVDWEEDARFDGFWNMPAPYVHFAPRKMT